MQMTEMQFAGGVPVESYGPGFFRIAGTVIDSPICLGPQDVQSWRGYEDLVPLEALAGRVDVLFIGTGAESALVPDEVISFLANLGLGFEAMASPTACRTYNVLLSEGRRVALAALPV